MTVVAMLKSGCVGDAAHKRKERARGVGGVAKSVSSEDPSVELGGVAEAPEGGLQILATLGVDLAIIRGGGARAACGPVVIDHRGCG